MFKNHKITNKYLALITFFISLVVYTLTLAPTASFWDAGEFIAVAYGLEVNHPPGAPFYSLIGRIFSMFMPTMYVAASINFISALTSALTVMLLYLIIVRLIREWKGHPDTYSTGDKIGAYGGGLVGSLTFAFTDTFWFSAVEAEVYAMSMFFTAIVVWLALKWAENHKNPANDRLLVVIAYMFGLAIGVHLLNLLAIFFVALIIYFKKQDFKLLSFALMGATSVVAFLGIYPFTIQVLPDVADDIGKVTYGLIGPVAYMIIIVASLAAGIYYTHTKQHRLANILLVSYSLILIGYSSYALIFIRSIANPPIDENDPESLESFVKYLKREQYGNTPIISGNTYNAAIGNIDPDKVVTLPRRWSPDPNHLQFYSQYSSDFAYFWDYQVKHMYLRYFNWNFIGREADIQDTGWQSGFEKAKYPDNRASNSYFYIPFLLGVFGFLYHFMTDWKRAFAVGVLFFMTGLAIIIFLNQTPFQPRERDYAYGGSFFAYAIWVGLGVTGLVELLQSRFKQHAASYALVGVAMLGSPILMGYQNWDDHDRSLRYVAPDYAANLLNSLAPNAIVFTNGDNDTFPLWYAQEVEGIRTDVRVVCLSLLNTDWYIRQLRDQWSHESAPLPIIIDDEEVNNITKSLSRWEPQVINIPVDKDFLKNAFSEDKNYKEAIGVKPDTSLRILQTGTDFEMPVDSLDDRLIWRYNGRSFGRDSQGNEVRYVMAQDIMILNILQYNNWLRPVYFANTVSTESQLGLNPYFRFEGKAYRVIPKQFNAGSFGHIEPSISADRYSKFRFTEWSNPNAYFDENIRRMLSNYRYGFTQLSDKYKAIGEIDSAAYWLKFGEENIPFRPDETEFNTMVLYAFRYDRVNLHEDALRLAEKAQSRVFAEIEKSYIRLLRLQDNMDKIRADFAAARRNGNVDKQRTLNKQLETADRQTQESLQAIASGSNLLVILQNIYFQNGKDAEALDISLWFENATDGQFTQQIGIPKTKEENSNLILRYNLE